MLAEYSYRFISEPSRKIPDVTLVCPMDEEWIRCLEERIKLNKDILKNATRGNPNRSTRNYLTTILHDLLQSPQKILQISEIRSTLNKEQGAEFDPNQFELAVRGAEVFLKDQDLLKLSLYLGV